MKIGEYVDTFFPTIDGVIMTVHNYALNLNRDSDSCFVATSKSKNEAGDTYLPYDIIRYASVPVPGRSGYRTGIPVLDAEFVAKEHELSPDIVHAHSPFAAGMESLRLAKHRNIPIVATFHSKYYDDFLAATGSTLIAEAATELVVMFYEAVDYVWTVNESTAKTLKDYGFSKEITIMPNGTDYVAPKDPNGSDAEINKRYALSEDEDMILFVGQQIIQKNIPKLIRAAELYAKNEKPFKLVLVGDGNDRAALEALAKETQINDRIIFTGAISDRSLLNAMYHRANVFAFPSGYAL